MVNINDFVLAFTFYTKNKHNNDNQTNENVQRRVALYIMQRLRRYSFGFLFTIQFLVTDTLSALSVL